jgi:hypothetical protein
MKRLMQGFAVFLITLISGFAIARFSLLSGEAVIQLPPQIDAIQVLSSQTSATPEPEFKNVDMKDEFETGDYHHFQPVFQGSAFLGKCEFDANVKGPWLALIKRGNRYTLERRQVKIGRAEEDSFGYFHEMHFADAKNALFLLGKSSGLKSGAVTTLFAGPSQEIPNETFLLGSEFRREFTLFGRSSVVRVSSATGNNGPPFSVLVLESEGTSEIIYKSSEPHGEGNFGELNWVGDLDGDHLLDLQIELFDPNGGGKSYILYISSIAKTGHLVQPYAFFHTRFRGC